MKIFSFTRLAFMALAVLATPALVSGAGAADTPAASVKLGDLVISDAFARATLPGAEVGGGYLTIINNGSAPDRLLAATSPSAKKVQLHSMTMVGNVMKMRPVVGGIAIPAGGSVAFTPTGFHIMFMGLNAPFAKGSQIPVTLEFQKAGSVKIGLAVGGIAATAPAAN